MPELPEVQTTVNGLNDVATGLTIVDVWTAYNSPYYHGSDTIKDPKYFASFKRKIIGKRIIRASRRAKNILIHLEGDHTILIHMKMTGHIMHGKYEFRSVLGGAKKEWLPTGTGGPLHDPFNRHLRLVLTVTSEKNGAKNGVEKHIVLSDMRKFAKVTLIKTSDMEKSAHLSDLGPEPLEDSFTFDIFCARLATKPNGKIKPTIMDQSVMAGVGNIYADESLWRAGIHPESKTSKIPRAILKKLYIAIRATLSKGIDFGGDSMSDYRNIHGERGKFQEMHEAYRRTGEKCGKAGCGGKIVRKVIAGRSGHFCDRHQKKF